MRTVLIIILAALLGGGGTYAWRYYGGFAGEKGTTVAFVESYGDYAEVADRVELLTHLPGTKNNSSREELLSLLNAILTEKIDAEKRESLARIAFTHVDTLKKEIDAAQSSQAKLYATLQDFDDTSRMFTGIELRTKAESIVALARKRAELSSRITSILAETNEYTYAIITRVLSERGALSEEHIAAINEATREAEDRFKTLEELYRELMKKKDELNGLFADFTQTAL